MFTSRYIFESHTQWLHADRHCLLCSLVGTCLNHVLSRFTLIISVFSVHQDVRLNHMASGFILTITAFSVHQEVRVKSYTQWLHPDQCRFLHSPGCECSNHILSSFTLTIAAFFVHQWVRVRITYPVDGCWPFLLSMFTRMCVFESPTEWLPANHCHLLCPQFVRVWIAHRVASYWILLLSSFTRMCVF